MTHPRLEISSFYNAAVSHPFLAKKRAPQGEPCGAVGSGGLLISEAWKRSDTSSDRNKPPDETVFSRKRKPEIKFRFKSATKHRTYGMVRDPVIANRVSITITPTTAVEAELYH
jgi:hypothetical protein